MNSSPKAPNPSSVSLGGAELGSDASDVSVELSGLSCPSSEGPSGDSEGRRYHGRSHFNDGLPRTLSESARSASTSTSSALRSSEPEDPSAFTVSRGDDRKAGWTARMPAGSCKETLTAPLASAVVTYKSCGEVTTFALERLQFSKVRHVYNATAV
jgi:hypothetical protein